MFDDEAQSRLLRGIKTVKALKFSCTSCDHERVERRGYPVKLWQRIQKTGALPPTYPMTCARCGKMKPHFVDWPLDA